MQKAFACPGLTAAMASTSVCSASEPAWHATLSIHRVTAKCFARPSPPLPACRLDDEDDGDDDDDTASSAALTSSVSRVEVGETGEMRPLEVGVPRGDTRRSTRGADAPRASLAAGAGDRAPELRVAEALRLSSVGRETTGRLAEALRLGNPRLGRSSPPAAASAARRRVVAGGAPCAWEGVSRGCTMVRRAGKYPSREISRRCLHQYLCGPHAEDFKLLERK